MAFSPVKELALRFGILVRQPEKVRRPEIVAEFAALAADAMVIVGFGQIIPQTIIDLPRLGIINVHASLLPKYRGAAPINWALIEGEKQTGVTIMRVEEGMDTGAMLLQRAVPIGPEEDAGTLHDRLADLGASALAEALQMLGRGEAAWMPQNEAEATRAPKIRDEDCRLTLAGDPGSLVNRVRGLYPVPGAYLLWNEQRLKVLRADRRPEAGPPGTILRLESQAIVCGTGIGALALYEVQQEGKRRMTGAEFARGQRLQVGDRLA